MVKYLEFSQKQARSLFTVGHLLKEELPRQCLVAIFPPMIIFKGTRLIDVLSNNAPNAALVEVSKKE